MSIQAENSQKFSLSEVFDNYPSGVQDIFDKILNFLDLSDLANFSRACKGFNNIKNNTWPFLSFPKKLKKIVADYPFMPAIPNRELTPTESVFCYLPANKPRDIQKLLVKEEGLNFEETTKLNAFINAMNTVFAWIPIAEQFCEPLSFSNFKDKESDAYIALAKGFPKWIQERSDRLEEELTELDLTNRHLTTLPKELEEFRNSFTI